MTTPTNDERFEELVHSVRKQYGHKFTVPNGERQPLDRYDMTSHPKLVELVDHSSTEIARLQAENTEVRKKLDEVHSWIVCASIASPDDMMQNAERIEEITRPAK